MTHAEWMAAAQLVIAALCAGVGIAMRQTWTTRRQSMGWMGIAMVLSLMAFLTALDMSRWLTPQLREWVQQEGMYTVRRPLQLVCLLVLLMAGATVLRLVAREFKALSTHVRVALFSCASMGAVQVMRTISFHYFDLILDYRIVGVSVGRLIEGLAMLLIMAAAAQALLTQAEEAHIDV